MTSPEPTTRPAGGIELNGLDTIQESERHGRPRDLFWPWFAANVSVLGLSYGSFLLGFGLSFWQATATKPQKRKETTIPITATAVACQKDRPKPSRNEP
jgi:hypothetical protein